ncbi:MAG TPA: FecR family protein, partial [Nitrospiraceae bacterium]|nr:FecR family protein [Nitrospiraceae bacterium]
MSTLLARILFVASLCLSIAASPARLPGTEPIGLVTTLEGKAYVAREGVSKPLSLGGQDEVLVHDVIETQSHSRLKILFRDDSLVTIAENSRIAIRDYAHGGQAPSKVVIQLDRGAIRSSIGGHPSAPESTFEVQTPAASMAAREAYFTVWIDEGVPALIQGIEQSSTKGTSPQGLLGPPALSLRQVGLANIGQVGSVTLTSGGETTIINPGQYLIALPNTGSLSPSNWIGTPPFPIAAVVAATDLKASPKLETPKETLRLVGGTADMAVAAGVSGIPPAALAPPVGQIRVPQVMMTPPF